MSSYKDKMRNKKTSTIETIYHFDDYFGHRKYGHQVEGKSPVYTDEELAEGWEALNEKSEGND